jgi:hypothetical protein
MLGVFHEIFIILQRQRHRRDRGGEFGIGAELPDGPAHARAQARIRSLEQKLRILQSDVAISCK